MKRSELLYFALGITSVLSVGAVTNQARMVTPTQRVALTSSSIIFPDGTEQTTAFAPGPRTPFNCFIGLGPGIEGTPSCFNALTKSFYSVVPPGMIAFVTDATAHRTNSSTTGDFLGVIGIDDADAFPTFPRHEVHGTALSPAVYHWQTPIIVMLEGERIAMRNESSSDIPVDFYVSGYLAPAP